jgi:2-keto-myo-inositol isomerase
MLKTTDFCINRKSAPGLSLPDFIKLANDLGIKNVELRNDTIGDADNSKILDGMDPEEVKDLLAKYDVNPLDINGQGMFDNLAKAKEMLASLDEMIKVGSSVGVQNILLCPTRDANDSRSEADIFAQAVKNLREISDHLAAAGMGGMIEPLGFTDSSIQTPWAAQDIIEEAGVDNIKIVADLFHYYLANVQLSDFNSKVDVSKIGLVHLSSVMAHKRRDQMGDQDRYLIHDDLDDVMKTVDVVKWIKNSSYKGLYSFEPFSDDLQKWDYDTAKANLQKSIDLIK